MGRFVDLEIINSKTTILEMKGKLPSARLRSVAYHSQKIEKDSIASFAALEPSLYIKKSILFDCCTRASPEP